MIRSIAFLCVISICQTTFAQDRSANAAQEGDSETNKKVKPRAIFSGPQVGETLPSFKVTGIFEPHAEKEMDPIKDANGKPTLTIFFNELTRPGFGLMNAVNAYASTRAKDGLKTTVVFLDDDPVQRIDWVKRVRRNLSKGPVYTMSKEGKAGPGAYGLDRKVHLTVLVGKDNKVTANFALTQPNLPIHGQQILKALVDVLGGGKVPDITAFSTRGMKEPRMRMRMSPKLAKLLAPLHDGKTSGEELKTAIAKVDEYFKQNPREKAAVAQSIPDAKRRSLDPQVIAALKRWQPEKKFDMRSLLQPLIRKDATDEEVDKAAAAVVKVIEKNEAAKKEVGRIATTIVNSDRLTNYGTKHCQDILRQWAKTYGVKPDGSAKPL